MSELTLCLLQQNFVYLPSGGLARTTGRTAGSRSGTRHPSGYRRVKWCGRWYREHRLVYWLHNGYMPVQVDHINGIRDDNRIENLRESTPNQNQWNRRSEPHYVASRGKWRAKVRRYGKDITIGYFDSRRDAKVAMDEFKDTHDGGFVRCVK
jgi:hypothetical protein